MKKQNRTKEFIGFYYIKNLKLCDNLIQYFENSENKEIGKTSTPTKNMDKSIKDSTDLSIFSVQNELIAEYCNELNDCLKLYINDFPYSNYYYPFGITEGFNIQKYEPNQGYFAWHTERVNPNPPICNRHLVFMTYLNNVTDGGQTEFYHQKLKVQPEKGLTLIWPADWTHTHRGITSPTQVKYIVTGWLNFIDWKNHEQTD